MVPQLRSHCLTGCQGEKSQLLQEGPEGISQRGHLSENLRGSLMTEKAKNGRQGLAQCYLEDTVDRDQDGPQSSHLVPPNKSLD